jgi:thiosulfate/3-mercaptopyruvate sulfurtransferase
MKRIFAVLFALAIFMPAMAAQRRPQAEVRAVRSDMLVSSAWLARHLKDPALVVLHVGVNRATYDAGHIPGARYLALGDISVRRSNVPSELPPADDLKRVFEQAGVGDKTRVILYGDLLGLAAARAYFTLDYLGHGDSAALLDGGLEKWKADQRPLTTEASAVKPATFTPRVRPELVVYLPDMRNLSWEAANDAQAPVALLDARPLAEYTGERARDGIPRAGHIPGALSLYWMDTLESKDNPEFLPPYDLRKLLDKAGVSGRHIVTYCVSGVQASHLYFVAKYLGYDPALYDGSFSEWSNTADAPVAREAPAR